MKSAPSPAFNHSFDGLIWCLKWDGIHNRLLIEIRKESELKTEYISVNLIDYSIHMIPVPGDLDWFSSLIGGYGDILIFSRFGDQKNPGVSRLQLIDTRKNKLLKEWSPFVLDYHDDHKIAGAIVDNGKKEPLLIDLNDWIHDVDHAKRSGQILLPDHLPAGDYGFQTIIEYLESFNVIPLKGSDYLEVGNQIFFTYYMEDSNKLQKYLIWIEEETLILQELIDSELKGVALDSFMICEDRLFFIKNRNELCIYEI